MRGNPYYQPNYEDYYTPYSFVDNPIPIGVSHVWDRYTRAGARRAGPALPILTAALPLAIGYSGYTGYKAQKEKEADERYRVVLKAEEIRIKNIVAAKQRHREKLERIDRQTEQTRLYLEPSKLENVAISEQDAPKIDKLSQQVSRTFPLIHMENIPPVIAKKRDPALMGPEIESTAKEIVNLIKEQGYNNVINSGRIPIHLKEILDNPSAAILSKKRIPKAFHAFFDDSTRKQLEQTRIVDIDHAIAKPDKYPFIDPTTGRYRTLDTQTGTYKLWETPAASMYNVSSFTEPEIIPSERIDITIPTNISPVQTPKRIQQTKKREEKKQKKQGSIPITKNPSPKRASSIPSIVESWPEKQRKMFDVLKTTKTFEKKSNEDIVNHIKQIYPNLNL